MIPKIIHQLWIGDKPRPAGPMDRWKEMNPDFEYFMWDEKMIQEKLEVNKRYQFKINNHQAIWGKADMYRWLILKKYGGIFIDADILPIEPLDESLLIRPFVCYEQEQERKDLLATSVQAYPPEHMLPSLAVEWIMNNNVNEERTKTQSWILVGPGLLTRTYIDMKEKGLENTIDIKPSYMFLPDHHTDFKYEGHSKVYGTHLWGSTRNNYDKIAKMKIPDHFETPSSKNFIDINLTNLKDKEIMSCLDSIKEMKGRYNIHIHYNKKNEITDMLLKWVKNTRWIHIYSTIPGEVSGTEI